MASDTLVAVEWSDAERAAWREPSQIKPSEWAARYRFLPRSQTAHAGPWDNDFTPMLRGIMDLPAAEGVTQVNVMKAAQIGVSEALRNFIGWAADTLGDPLGLAMPDRDKGRAILGNRVIPMFRETPRLARHIGGSLQDLTKQQIRLSKIGWLLHLMWSGSASSMSSDPMRFCINDELDKFALWAGAEAGPVELTQDRLRSYGDRSCQINVSTPTTRFGMIFILWDGSDVKLYFFVPCPKCKIYQRLVWGNLHWRKSDSADRVKRAEAAKRSPAWYECDSCSFKIREHHRLKMMSLGRWSSEDGTVVDAEAIVEWPAGTHIGIQISAMYCPWTEWSSLAAEFLLAKGDLSKQFKFRTGTLGDAFEQQVQRARSDFYADKSKAATLPEGVVPKWAAKLICTIDSQHDHFWVVVRAWGPDMRSARVWHGCVDTFAELDKLLFYQRWRVEDDAWPAPQIELTLIDTGGTQKPGDSQSRTMEIYRWANGRRGRVRPIKGEPKDKAGQSFWSGKTWITAEPARRARRKSRATELRLWHVCTGHFRDELAHYTMLGGGGKPDDPPEAWALNTNNDGEYNTHMGNMHKIVVRTGLVVSEEWKPIGSGARHDFHDCETYQFAGAYMAQIHALPGSDEFLRMRAAAQAPPVRRSESLQDQALSGWGDHV